MEIEEAEAIFPVGWAAFIRGMEGPANYTGRINFEAPSALECMARLLDETPIEDIALYMKVTILLHRAEVLDSGGQHLSLFPCVFFPLCVSFC